MKKFKIKTNQIVLIILVMISGIIVYFNFDEIYSFLNIENKLSTDINNEIFSIEKDLKNIRYDLTSISKDLENQIDELSKSDISSNNTKKDEEYNLLENIDLSDKNINEIKKAYTEAILGGDHRLQLKLLEEIYEETEDSQILYNIFDKSIEFYDFERAVKYLRIIQKNDKELKKGDPKRFLDVMFNGFDLNTKNIDYLRNIIKLFLMDGYIDNNDFYFYNLLIFLTLNDLESFDKNFGGLTGENYIGFIEDVKEIKEIYRTYTDTPNYYYKGLLSFILFKHGYFSIAEKISIEILKINSNYFLPNQIIAYSNFVKNNFLESEKYFKKLIKIDSSNQDEYKFFLGIASYWNGNYHNSIIYLTQIENFKYILDVYRYLILSYYEIDDDENTAKYIKNLLKNIRDINEYDFYFIFDIFFYKPFKNDKGFELLKNNKDLAFYAIKSCSKYMSYNNIFICNYGKAGYGLISKKESTLTYLLKVAELYKRNYIFDAIGNLYYKKGEYENAKKYYLKALLYTNDEQYKNHAKNKIVQLILKNEKK